jgi:hypothetical protein
LKDFLETHLGLVSFAGTNTGGSCSIDLFVKLVTSESSFIKEGNEPEGVEEPGVSEEKHLDGDSIKDE